MPKVNAPLLAFNRGIISASALARVDVERVRLSAEQMANWIPKTQGGMQLRPGLQYLGTTLNSHVAKNLEFVASTSDVATVEITNQMRVWVGGDTLIEREAVSTTISNGDFATSANWTDSSTGGGTLVFGAAGLILNAETRGGEAICEREITVAAPDQNVEHALAIEVARGPVTFKVGSTAGDDDYVTETSLGTGMHSLAFTPTGNFHLYFRNTRQTNSRIQSIAIEAAGPMVLGSPYASADLPNIRYCQSGDVLFVACNGYQQRRIERRGTGRSWSIIAYDVEDGPFDVIRDADVRLRASITYGSHGHFISDKPYFKPEMVGQLFRLFNEGHHGTFDLAADDTWTDPLRMTGVTEDDTNATFLGAGDRIFQYTISNGAAGDWTGGGANVRVQRSFDDIDGGYRDYRQDWPSGSGTVEITSNGSHETGDSDDNAIVYYRVGFADGAYVGGSAQIEIDYPGGGDYGIGRITNFNSETDCDIEVLKDFNDTKFTRNWVPGLWSDHKGWPSAVALFEGRLWWAGNIRIFGSVSDAYHSFTIDQEGDAGPIVRSIGEGPVDVIHWLLPLQRLIFGTAGAETSLKSSSFDEPLTPQAFGARAVDTHGSANVTAAKVDTRGVFVDRSLTRVFELLYDPDTFDYTARELTLLCPDITETHRITHVAIQRHPDTRIHFVLDNGSVMICTYEPVEDVLCWSRFSTNDGNVEDIDILPGEAEDKVHYTVQRTIDGHEVRYREKWSKESHCKGEAVHRQLDSWGEATGPTSTVTGATHLIGEEVAVWANGVCLEDTDGSVKTFTVNASGEIALGASYSNITYGKSYTGRYISSKLAYAAGMGTALTQVKKAVQLGLVLGTAHYKGLEVGRDFNNMDNLPLVDEGTDVPVDTVFTEYDAPMRSIPGKWNTDSRLCMRATAPRPCEVFAAVVQVQTNDRG